MKAMVKKILKSCAIGRLVYEPLHRCYRLYSVPHRRHVLQKNGAEALKHVFEVFERRKINGFMAAGTLLGFIREGHFMSHDDDIDVGILPESRFTPSEVLKMLVEEEGFRFEFAFQFRGKTVEFKVSYHGVPIDVFCYERDHDGMYCTCFYYLPEESYPSSDANSVWRIHEYGVTTLKDYLAAGVGVKIPENPDKVLEKLYGTDWRTPNPNWNDAMHPGREVMYGEYGYSVTYEEAIRTESTDTRTSAREKEI